MDVTVAGRAPWEADTDTEICVQAAEASQWGRENIARLCTSHKKTSPKPAGMCAAGIGFK